MSKYTFTQHVPAMVDLGDTPPISFHFDTVEELINHEYVKRFDRDDHIWKLSHPSYHGDRCSLLTVKNDDSWWWVVGHIANGEELELPKWR